MDRVRLRFMPDVDWANVRELSGSVEQLVDATTTLDAIRLVDCVLVDAGDAAVPPGSASALSAADRDLVLAAIYRRTYGNRIESTVACAQCHATYDLDFDLTDLIETLYPAGSPAALPNGTGLSIEQKAADRYRLEDGTVFRLPTGADEVAVMDLPADEAARLLLRRCLAEDATDEAAGSEGGGLATRDAVAVAMNQVAPVLDIDLDARCPECGSEQASRFVVQHYLLGSLVQERDRLARDVHELATAYGWSLGEIMDMPRSQRRRMVDLVLSTGRGHPGIER